MSFQVPFKGCAALLICSLILLALANGVQSDPCYDGCHDLYKKGTITSAEYDDCLATGCDWLLTMLD